ncbi:Protein CBR-RUVB-1 [Caenorhabditis briggsae]|uniref:RuvB-like helicase n=3 Tax=Caenorhabditis briggsae TaxID=6238 RepID=A0AAE9D0Y6_CAEBR|nr:Protein CBR-RUVB-1 [Caenorhabditis briggsae]ULT91043.1 hypothetical protein L3Y34_008970 [Caenorhabditis briggsae]CAP36675.1 Protein CBR-RUVB-1 [Caenorhabditis briggsae]
MDMEIDEPTNGTSSSRLAPIEEVKPTPKQIKRIAAHSHVKGLGIDTETNEALPEGAGFVGQIAARTAASIIVDMIRMKSMAGRAVLLAGPPATGKTAIALAMSHELGDGVPFVPLVASEVFSSEVKKTEVLMRSFRRAIGLRVKETKDVYEGEVTELTPVETSESSGLGKTISHLLIGLKTAKGSKQLKLDPSIYDSILKQRVEVGDVIYIEANSGIVKRVGRCDVYASEFDLEADEFVPMPKGDVRKSKDIVQNVSLHDLDLANSRPQGRQGDVTNIVSQLMAPKKTEVTDRLRSEINKVVNEYIESGVAELMPGVLFIDEVHMLDVECFTYLYRALESPMAPVVVFATNRGTTTVRGLDDKAPHGIPPEMLDRLMIIPTMKYNEEDVRKILAHRTEAENVQFDEKAFDLLSRVGSEKSLRYALQLIAPARLCAQTCGREIIDLGDVERCTKLFMDRSESLLKAEEAQKRLAEKNSK